ncbi:MAG TPA: urease accessory protein UreD [Trebonia sp.]
MTRSAPTAARATGPAAAGPTSNGRADGGTAGRHARNRVCAAAAVEAVAGPGGVTRFPVLASQVPLVLRRTPSAVYLVGGAAGPIGGDRLELRITVGAGAFLRLRTAAASIALPGLDGLESELRVIISVGAGGRLEYLPEPVVVADGARHATHLSVSLAAGAALLLRDELLLGRYGEDGGTARSVLRADYDGHPLLRHAVQVSGSDPVSRGPAVLAGHRAVGMLLRVGSTDAGSAPGTARRAAEQLAVAALPLAGGAGELTVALADDAVTLRRRLSG